ncbi:MAG TPA: copper chaperone PCu(A)C [Gracilimonas sp.]|uniref:copper chaperone PCu(A)C n=1 Tax=Gracilimonas sp. TaxID=1974203 RepID=UPI002D8D1DFE|nr:copper chaperone PCu(A)C [Gracilimonas sp.]
MKAFRYLLAITVFPLLLSCEAEQKDGNSEAELNIPGSESRVRPAAARGTSAAYLVYTNSLEMADTLRSVNSPVAGLVQVHEAYETEEGMMGMRQQKELVVQPGESISFKKGGLHIMLMDLNKDLKEGDSVRVELEFSQAGQISRMLPVQL